MLGAALALSCHRTPEDFAPTTTSALTAPEAPSAVTPKVAPSDLGRRESRADPACPPDDEPNLAALPRVTVKLVETKEEDKVVDAELARGEHDTTRGLMFRTAMAEDHGMLFLLPRAEHTFWMHNTCIPLDILFIDGDRVVGVVENAPTLNDDPRGGHLSSKVLELNGGYCKRHGVGIGTRVVIGDLPR